jgi:hypothetical protein
MNIIITINTESVSIPLALASSKAEAREIINNYIAKGPENEWPAPESFSLWVMGDGPATLIGGNE